MNIVSLFLKRMNWGVMYEAWTWKVTKFTYLCLFKNDSRATDCSMTPSSWLNRVSNPHTLSNKLKDFFLLRAIFPMAITQMVLGKTLFLFISRYLTTMIMKGFLKTSLRTLYYQFCPFDRSPKWKIYCWNWLLRSWTHFGKSLHYHCCRIPWFESLD